MTTHQKQTAEQISQILGVAKSHLLIALQKESDCKLPVRIRKRMEKLCWQTEILQHLMMKGR